MQLAGGFHQRRDCMLEFIQLYNIVEDYALVENMLLDGFQLCFQIIHHQEAVVDYCNW